MPATMSKEEAMLFHYNMYMVRRTEIAADNLYKARQMHVRCGMKVHSRLPSPALSRDNSHQWTSFNHPDPNHQQLRTFQKLLMHMICGQCPDTAPTFADAAVFPSSMRITTAEWRESVRRAYIWMDYFSVRASTSVRAR